MQRRRGSGKLLQQRTSTKEDWRKTTRSSYHVSKVIAGYLAPVQLITALLSLHFFYSAQKRPSKAIETEPSNGVDHTEANGDIEPAAKRPKHQPTNGVSEDESRDQTSSENHVKTEPKKEVSCE